MKVLDIILESPKIDPRVLSDDQIMGVLQQAIKSNPQAMKDMANNEIYKGMGFFAKRRALAQEAETALNMRYGPYKGVLTAIRVIEPLAQWYIKMLALNECAKEKLPNGEYKYSDDILSNTRNEISGIMAAQYILPILAQGAVEGTLLIFGKELFKSLIRNMAGKGGGWGIFISGIAYAAGWAYFEHWLGTPEGVEWLKSWMPAFIIQGAGAIANIPLNWLMKKVPSVDPAPDARQRIDTSPDLSMSDDDIEKARTRRRSLDQITPFKMPSN